MGSIEPKKPIILMCFEKELFRILLLQPYNFWSGPKLVTLQEKSWSLDARGDLCIFFGLTDWKVHSIKIKSNKFYQVGHCPNAFPPEYYFLRWWKYTFWLKINFVDSKIMTMVAIFCVKIEQVISFPNTVSTKKIQAHPTEKDTLSIVNKCTCYSSQ